MTNRSSRERNCIRFAVLCAALLWFGFHCPDAAAQNTESSAPSASKEKEPDDPSSTRLRIIVTNFDDKPVSNASVYVRFNEAGGFLHKEKLSEMSFKTNDDGSVKVPGVPVGKVLIQVVAKGLHTYGKWYDVAKDQEAITIKLDHPAHWY